MTGSNTSDVLIAIVSTAGVVIAALIRLIIGMSKARTENRKQHDSVEVALGRLAEKTDLMHEEVKSTRAELRVDVQRLHDRMNDHIVGHDQPTTKPAKPKSRRSQP